MRERSSVWFPKGFIPRKNRGQKAENTTVQQLIYGGGLRGRIQLLTNRENTGEDHRVGLAICKPMGNTRGGEQSKQTNGASNIRGFPEQGAGTMWD